MIVRQLKDIDEIRRMLGGYKKVAIIGCAGCYGEGGVEGVDRVSLVLRENGVNVVAAGVTGRQCSWVERAREKNLDGDAAIVGLTKGVEVEDISEADALLSLACGVGAQTLEKFAGNRALVPGFNTFFMGRREGASFYEQCIGCGNCILHLTGGICPVAKCPKSDMNGPCGGVRDGRCEVYPDRECVWIQIYQRLKGIGELDKMREIKSPKDFSLRTHPRGLE
jgi:hypothetical protein